jgi:sterol desaturase/sphingolipid hydroxylase (fatty acid hydroxylase superfamily)
VTTGTRFHPVEMVLSMLVKLAAISVLGAPATAVLAFEILLNACALFNHGNVGLPGPLDRALRRLIVTPDMHRIHHSRVAAEANSNYGFNLAWWDRLFGTYRADASLPQDAMAIGAPGVSGDARAVSLTGLLAIPFDAGYGGRVPAPSPAFPDTNGVRRPGETS